MIYVLLMVAIVLASVGDAALKKSSGFQRWGPATVGVVIYLITFYLLSVVMLELPVGVTYATWSGIGVILTAFVGVLVFNEQLNKKVVISMGVIIAGVVLLNV
ncbi:DMT family transporter [Natribacillus halophilus]|uniref:Small multidrug resistance pump n=1 Tax=Natribacillus halophilus TaxID=549003 RepID=A0A1G8PI19_9BACI|nr:multidrug efflux SMR transporter [Natribacillus halophilus]SDI92154.1 small multidrug resistance pump [Natribacillus halophilus]